MKVREYPGIVSWPPLPGGAYAGLGAFPLDQAVTLTEVFPVVNEFVTFTCEFLGNQHTYDLQMTDEETAEGFSVWLKKHVGKALEQFGEF